MQSSFGGLLLLIFGALAVARVGSIEPTIVHHNQHAHAVLTRAVESQKTYSLLIAKTYSYPFGENAPFLPSNAKTQNGRFISPRSFPTAEYCGHCHQAAYREWSESAHRNSFREPFYKKNVDLLINGKGIAFSRHCEGCHNPIALFSGALTPKSRLDRSFDEDGITCSVCHSIARLQPSYGTASYVMGVPAVMIDEKGHPITGAVPDDEIFAHPDRHRQAVMRGIYKSPEFCGACHEASIPRTLNAYKWVRAISTYDEWQRSAYAKRSPMPFYNKDYRSCQDCHMRAEPIHAMDFGANNGMLASHRWLGGNTAISLYYGFHDQLEATKLFLAKQRVAIDIFGIKKSPMGRLIAPLGSTTFNINPGTALQTLLVVTNKGLGHSLIPEQRDIFQAWIEFSVADSTGHELFHSGSILPDGKLAPHSYSFTTRLIDKDGKLLSRHEVWERRAIGWDKTILPGHSIAVRYRFIVPLSAKGPLTLTARVNYRHLNQDFLNFALGSHHPPYPIVKMAEDSRQLGIGENHAESKPMRFEPQWMRWNNYGIALMGEGRFGEAETAFQHLLTLRPRYTDGAINTGVADLRMGQYGAALQQFTHALRLNPKSDRARFYLALTEINDGELRRSTANLRIVAARFPKSTEVHRELGICYYLQRRYRASRDEFKVIQTIEPDDLTAHYYLSLLYRWLDQPELAQQQARLYETEKSDPSGPTTALRYLDSGKDLYGESLSTHVYGDTGPAEQLSTKPARPASPARSSLNPGKKGFGHIVKSSHDVAEGEYLK